MAKKRKKSLKELDLIAKKKKKSLEIARAVQAKKKIESTKPLTEQQELFVREYLKDHNKKEAAIRSGYSVSTAASIGCNLYKIPKINKAIKESLTKKMRKINVDSNVLFNELVAMSTFDVGDMFDDHGNIKNIKDIPPSIRKAIGGVDVTTIIDRDGNTVTTTKFKLSDKLKSIETLGKYMLKWAETHQVKHEGKFTLESMMDTTVKKIQAIDITEDKKSKKVVSELDRGFGTDDDIRTDLIFSTPQTTQAPNDSLHPSFQSPKEIEEIAEFKELPSSNPALDEEANKSSDFSAEKFSGGKSEEP